MIPVSWFLITLEFSGRKRWITSKKVALLAVIPLTTLVLAWTNSYHHLLWQNIPFDQNNPDGNWRLAVTETLYEISRSLISTETLDMALQSILAKVALILNCTRVSLILLDMDQEQVIGLLNLDSTQLNFYVQEHAKLATVYAANTAIAIENARMYATEQQRVRQLDAIRAKMTDISSELGLSKLLRAILLRAIGLLNASGDEVRIELAQRMQSKIRDIDILARYDGEEFTILMPEINAQDAFVISERIRESISQSPFEAKGFLFNISVSNGIASNHPGTSDLADLIEQADQALSAAKHTGRNQISVR